MNHTDTPTDTPQQHQHQQQQQQHTMPSQEDLRVTITAAVKDIEVAVDRSESVESLVAKLEEEEDIPSDQQQLITVMVAWRINF